MTFFRKNFGALLVVDLKHSVNFAVSELNCSVDTHWVGFSKFPIYIKRLELLTSHAQMSFGTASVCYYDANLIIYFLPVRGCLFFYFIEENFQLIKFVLRQTFKFILWEDYSSHISNFGEETWRFILDCSAPLSFGLCLK